MKRIKTAIIIMAAVLVAAMGVYIAVSAYNDKVQKEAEEEANRLIMFSFDSDDVNSVEIHNESGDYEISYDSTWGWSLDNIDDFRLNSNTIATILSYMEELTADKIMEDGSDPSKYGFDDPITITAETYDETYTLYVGDVNATYENIYMMKEGSSDIYVVPYTTGYVFCLTKDSLKTTYIADFLSSQINEFCLWQGAEKDENILFHMTENDDGTWHMSQPYDDDTAYNTDVSEFINDAIRDEVNSFVEENLKESDYGKYGFDDPSYVFEISGDDAHAKVIFGDDTEDGNNIYVLLADSGQVATAEKGTISILGYTTSDMMNTVIYSETISNVVNNDITFPDGSQVLLTIDASNKEYTCDDSTIDSTDDDAVAAFVDFYNSFNEAYNSATPLDADPEEDPYLTIEYVLTSNETALVEYVPVSDDPSDGYYAFKNNYYTGYVISGDVMDNILSAYETLEGYLN